MNLLFGGAAAICEPYDLAGPGQSVSLILLGGARASCEPYCLTGLPEGRRKKQEGKRGQEDEGQVNAYG